MASTMNPMEIGQLMLDEVIKLTGATCATIYFRDQQAQRLVPKLFQGWANQSPAPLDLLQSDDLAVEAVLTGRPRQHARHTPDPCAAAPDGTDSSSSPVSNAAVSAGDGELPPHCRLCTSPGGRRWRCWG